ncbi:MAG: pyroglutamyl-peptidase I [Lysobacterales bacterium]
MKKSATILLTGFEPFGGERVNPSQEIVRALDGGTIAGHRVVGAILPVAFAATLPMLEDLLARHRPHLALALGQAGGRSELSLERVAINLIDARIADNQGSQPIDEAVVADAPGAYFSSLPLKAIEAHLRALGIPVAPSLSAGSFVCNHAFFALAHLIATRHPHARGGFMHVPWLPEQAAHHPGQPSMALDTMIAGVRAALECALATPHDLDVAGGATH